MPLDVNIIYFLLSFVIPIIKLSLSSVNITKRRKRKIATACRISYEGYAGKITLPWARMLGEETQKQRGMR